MSESEDSSDEDEAAVDEFSSHKIVKNVTFADNVNVVNFENSSEDDEPKVIETIRWN